MKHPISFAIALLCFLLTACSSRMPHNLGLYDQKFTQCPDKPNCVSTFSNNPQHAIEPIKTQLSAQQNFEFLLKVLSNHKNSKLVVKQSPYLHSTFHSTVFGFVDDVEWLVENNRIHVRSASRIGYSDFGVNRKRIERIREQFNKQDMRDSL